MDAYNNDPENKDKQISLDNIELREGVTVTLNPATGLYEAPEGAEGYADFINAGIAEQKRLGTVSKNLPAQMHLLILNDDEKEKINALAGILGRNSEAPVTMVTRGSWDLFNKLHKEVSDGKVELGTAKADAYMRALATVAHEAFGHITNIDGSKEASAMGEGMQVAAIMAIRAFSGHPAVDVANAFLRAFTPYGVGAKDDAGNLLFAGPAGLAPNVAWAEAIPDLAKAIAELVSPAVLSEQQQQAVVDILKTRFPHLSDYYLQQKVADEQNIFHRMMNGQNGGDDQGGGSNKGKNPDIDPAAKDQAERIISESGPAMAADDVSSEAVGRQQ